MLLSALSRTSVTSATPAGGKESDPEKSKSLIKPARKRLGLPSPRANNTASVMLLLPEPFGPTIAVTPPESGILTGRANVLKPFKKMAESIATVYAGLPHKGSCGKVQQTTVHNGSLGTDNLRSS